MANYHLALNEKEKAAKALQHAIEGEPDNYWYRQTLAIYYQNNREYDKAIASIEEMQQRFPKRNGELLPALVSLYNHMGQYDKVIDALARLEVITGKSEAISMEKARNYLLMGKTEGAFSEMEALAKEYPDNSYYRVILAEVYMDHGRADEAESILRGVLTEEPDNGAAKITLTEYYRLQGDTLKNGDGESVPLTTFVEVRDTTGVEYISQFNIYRSIDINVTPVSGASSGDVINAIERIADDVLPNDTSIAWSGVSFQEQEEGSKGAWVFLIAFVFVFFTLSSLYESWSLPLAIVAGVPLAVLGALCGVGLAHLVAPQFINDIYMQISLAMLIGLAAKNSILVVEYADKLFHEERKSLLEATIDAAKMRVRPILMTAFASILGMLPLVFASGVYSTARNIMGVSLVSGLLFATLFGIILYPALYYLVGKVARFEQKRKEDNYA